MLRMGNISFFILRVLPIQRAYTAICGFLCFPSFLLVNSVALHGDGCPICQAVEKELLRLSKDLNCSLQVRTTPLYTVAL